MTIPSEQYLKMSELNQLREKRMDFMWNYFVKCLSTGNEHLLITLRDNILDLDKKIRSLQE